MVTKTVTVYKRPRFDMNKECRSFQFTYTPDRSFVDQDVKAITFDGKYLWFATQGSTVAGAHTNLLQVDIRSGVKLRQITIDVPSNATVRDFCFDGHNFYVLYYFEFDFTPSCGIGLYSKAGKRIRDLVLSGLSTTHHGITFDGQDLIVTRQATVGVQWYADVYDITGNLMRQVILLNNWNTAAGETCKPCFDGNYLLTKIDPTFFMASNMRISQHKWVRENYPATLWWETGRHQLPVARSGEEFSCTTDGLYLYEFTQVV